jgi:Flp pilus assembly pilin Flp
MSGGHMPHAEKLWRSAKRLWRSEDGQDITEYVLFLAIIALLTVSLITAPMSSVNKIWVYGNAELSSAVTTAAS